MTPHLVVRVDGDTFAVAHRGDLRDAMSRAMATAIPDPGSTVHAAIVLASDAGAARLAPVDYWVGTDDTDPDTVHETLRALGIDPDEYNADRLVDLAVVLVDAIRTREIDASEAPMSADDWEALRALCVSNDRERYRALADKCAARAVALRSGRVIP